MLSQVLGTSRTTKHVIVTCWINLSEFFACKGSFVGTFYPFPRDKICRSGPWCVLYGLENLLRFYPFSFPLFYWLGIDNSLLFQDNSSDNWLRNRHWNWNRLNNYWHDFKFGGAFWGGNHGCGHLKNYFGLWLSHLRQSWMFSSLVMLAKTWLPFIGLIFAKFAFVLSLGVFDLWHLALYYPA